MTAKKTGGFFRTHPAATTLIGLVTASFALRLWPVLTVGQSWEDAYFFIGLARSLAQGRYELLGQFHSKYLPGFPAAILVLHTIGLGLIGWFRSAQFVSALSSSALPGLCFLLAWDITGDRRAAGAAGLMAALNAHLITFGGMAFSEAFFTMQAMLVLVLLRRAPLLAGIIAGYAAVTRHEGWFLAAAFLALAALSDERRRLLAGLGIALLMGAAWWLIYHMNTGEWPYQIYLVESAERAPTMGRPGLKFLLASFPAAGHLTTLLALAGLPVMFRKREGWPALAFFIPYSALHAWWMFGVERYFVPLIPLVCVAAGSGLWSLENLARTLWNGAPPLEENSGTARSSPRLFRARALMVPALGLIAGASHFAGFAPAMVHEEAVRTSGYLKAIREVAAKPEDFSVLAYDAFMVGYYDPRHPVIPSGMLPDTNWMETIPPLYLEQGLRYIIWSDLYPSDRAQTELSPGRELLLQGKITQNDERRTFNLRLVPERQYIWLYEYPQRGWLRPWRAEVSEERKAIIYRLELMPGA